MKAADEAGDEALFLFLFGFCPVRRLPRPPLLHWSRQPHQSPPPPSSSPRRRKGPCRTAAGSAVGNPARIPRGNSGSGLVWHARGGRILGAAQRTRDRTQHSSILSKSRESVARFQTMILFFRLLSGCQHKAGIFRRRKFVSASAVKVGRGLRLSSTVTLPPATGTNVILKALDGIGKTWAAPADPERSWWRRRD